MVGQEAKANVTIAPHGSQLPSASGPGSGAASASGARMVPSSLLSDSSNLDLRNVEKPLSAMATNIELLHKRLDDVADDKRDAEMAANIEGLHERLDDMVDDVTQLLKLRNKMAKNANRLHVMVEDE